MHDESPSGQACADRTLAFWTDQRRFGRPIQGRNDLRSDYKKLGVARRFGAGFLIGTIFAAMIGS